MLCVRIHAWGPDLTAALEETVVAMFGYMTNLATVEIDESKIVDVEADGT